MGVKSLLSLLQDSSEACSYVSIEKLANDHRRSFGCSPVLVVDGSNFIPSLYTSGKYTLECIYGVAMDTV
ncbi:unnamed protein product [Larinioides sclopetarius]|uniref:Uncharacterized protein n=1 Tax=Larinioides sclopetarius TaxID=280406 RepID=A0AAV2B9A8_9ARAC